MPTEESHDRSSASGSSQDSGVKGDTVRTTASDRVAERLRTVLPDLSDRDAVKKALELYGTARGTMSRQITFDSLLDFCTATRGCWNVIHDAWLFDVSGELLAIGDLIREFVAALENSDPIIQKLIEGLSDESEVQFAKDYRLSIQTRRGFAATLLREGMEAVYVEMRDIARGKSEVASDVKQVMSDRIRASMPANRAGFARTAYAWLRHKLALLSAELQLEHGPWALASYGQSTIAIRTKRSVSEIRGCIEELCSEEKNNKVSPFLTRLDEYLETLGKKIVDPLERIVNGVLERWPDRGLWLEKRHEIEGAFGEEAECRIKSLGQEVLSLQEDIEPWSRQLETLCGPGELSVLIYPEPCDGCDPWLAHGLELGLVAQGNCVESAIHRLSLLVQTRLQDIDTGKYSQPLPAEAEYFQSFDTGEDCTAEYDVSNKFPAFRSVVVRRAAEVPG